VLFTEVTRGLSLNNKSKSFDSKCGFDQLVPLCPRHLQQATLNGTTSNSHEESESPEESSGITTTATGMCWVFHEVFHDGGPMWKVWDGLVLLGGLPKEPLANP